MNLGVQYLTKAFQNGCSDIHFNTNQEVMIRIHGDIRPAGKSLFQKNEIDEFIYQVLSEKQITILKEQGEVDFAYDIPNVSRFRGNAFKDKDGYGLSFRIIPNVIPTMEALNLPPVLKTLCTKEKGMIIVTGPTGHGKSTTLASMVDYINENMPRKIITLEEPIEYQYTNKKSRIVQRQVGIHTQSFTQGLRACLRQDPDIILMGEMRDLETISTAMTAVETGHLVLGTLHTVDAIGTVQRIIDSFPHYQQNQIRTQLAMNLLGVVAQRLLRKSDNSGRVGAFEILINNMAVKNLIRSEKVEQVKSVMQTNRGNGMMTMEDSLNELLEYGMVSEDEVNKHLDTIREED